MNFTIGDGITLRDYLATLNSEKSSEWMICDQINYSLDMVIYSVHPESWDFEDDEYEQLEDAVLSHGKGFGSLLNADQLEDIITNLKMQKADYSDTLLENAINYYSEYDAFYQISNT